MQSRPRVDFDRLSASDFLTKAERIVGILGERDEAANPWPSGVPTRSEVGEVLNQLRDTHRQVQAGDRSKIDERDSTRVKLSGQLTRLTPYFEAALGLPAVASDPASPGPKAPASPVQRADEHLAPMDKSYFNQANAHLLQNLLRTSETKVVVASEDIYDDRGTKLWARDRPLSLSMQERLLARRLKKPLELSLSAKDGVNSEDLVRGVGNLLENRAVLASIARGHTTKIIELFGRVRLGGVPQLLLTASMEDSSNSFLHAVLVALLSACIARRLSLPDSRVEEAIVAGLLHDLGEMYVNADYLSNASELNTRQWKEVAVHPRVGSLLLGELAGYPRPLAMAVQEHHERLDGTGYPAGSDEAGITPAGRILIVAEALSSILLSREDTEARALLALRLVPTQFPLEIVAALTPTLVKRSRTPPPSPSRELLEKSAGRILDCLTRASAEAQALEQAAEVPARGRLLASRAQAVSTRLSMALHSSGVFSPLNEAAKTQNDPAILWEQKLVLDELKWRLRSLSRYIETVASLFGGELHFRPLIDSLRLNEAPIISDRRALFADLEEQALRTARFILRSEVPQGEVIFDTGAAKFILEADGRTLWYLRSTDSTGFFAYETLADSAHIDTLRSMGGEPLDGGDAGPAS